MKSFFIIILFIILTFGCEERKLAIIKKIDKLAEGEQPDQVSSNVTVIFADSAFTKAVLHAKYARVYQKRMETYLDSGMKVDFMSQKSANRISVLTADSARIDDRTKNMLARGHVLVISDSANIKLETTLLEWNNSTQKIYSSEYVVITTDKEIIRGYGFESDPNLANYKINRVSGIQRVR
jgi:LPS export ABC transporter protein LptC